MKSKMLWLPGVCCLLIVLVAFMSGKAGKTGFENARETIVMREIGHRVLQYTGDSSSRVLPVEHLSGNEFLIPFESRFAFKPDSLIEIIGAIISKSGLPNDYIVNVLEPFTHKVIFGYVMSSTKTNDIIPCKGRDQPLKHYNISIQFQETKPVSTQTLCLAGMGLAGVVLLTSGLRRRKKRPRDLLVPESNETVVKMAGIQIGNYHFNADEQSLVFNGEKIVLTGKESKLLAIFASSPNQVIDRNRLQKEVWEDEGVIVGRSLDMFVSKLRKKLELDPAVRLVNIHGKGYRLEVGSQ